MVEFQPFHRMRRNSLSEKQYLPEEGWSLRTESYSQAKMWRDKEIFIFEVYSQLKKPGRKISHKQL